MKKIGLLITLSLFAVAVCLAQNNYFIDGYHGGTWGHYPSGYTGFMVKQMDKNPFWKINLEIEPVTWDVAKQNDFENYQKFQEYVQDQSVNGRIEFVNPSYGQSYLFNLQGESIIRQFQLGIKKLKEHFPKAIFNTYSSEEPCFTSALPQILKSLGFKYASLKNPNTCWGGYTKAFGGELVNWIGPDGSRLLTVPRYASEALLERSTWQTTAWNNSKDYLESANRIGIQNPIGMCLQDAGWKNGPWLGQPTNFSYKLWTDYVANIADHRKAIDWKLTQEDVQVSLVWGAQLLQKMAQQTRAAENHIVMAEKIAAIETVSSKLASRANQFERAWQNLLLAQHHDSWIVPYNIVNQQKKWNWAQQVTYWVGESNRLTDSVLQNLDVKFSPVVSKGKVKIYNTLAQSREEVVAVPLAGLKDNPTVLNELGRPVNTQLISGHNGRKVLLIAAKVPAMGFTTYTISQSEVKEPKVSHITKMEGKYIVTTDWYQVTINPAKGGVVESLLLKKDSNRQLVGLRNNYHFNEMSGYFYDEGRFLSSATQQANITVLEDGQLRSKLKIEGRIGAHPFTQELTFTQGDPKIDVHTKVDWKGNPGIGQNYAQKSGWKPEDRQKAFYNDSLKFQVRFPLNWTDQKVFKNAGFDVLESQLKHTYFNTWDHIKNNIIVNWVDVSNHNGSYGLAILNDHTSNYSHGEDGVLRLTLQYSGMGLWGRNYAISGSSQYHYSILPHIGTWDRAAIWTQNLSWNEPLQVSVAREGDPKVFSLISVADGYEVSAITLAEKSISFRIFNASANRNPVRVMLGYRADQIDLKELNGDILQAIQSIPTGKGLSYFNATMPRFGLRTYSVAY